MSREHELASAVVELAETAADDADALALLQELADRVRRVLSVDVVGVLLVDHHGTPRLAASTTHEERVLALLELGATSGPFVTACVTGRPVLDDDPEQALRRWPDFVQAVQVAGLRSVHVVPVRVRTDVIGALGLLCAQPRRLDDDDLAIAAALGGVAAIGLAQERRQRHKELLVERLQAALHQRVVLEQAKGMVAERGGVGVAEAFDLLRAHGERTGVRIGVAAQAVLDGRLGIAELRGDG